MLQPLGLSTASGTPLRPPLPAVSGRVTGRLPEKSVALRSAFALSSPSTPVGQPEHVLEVEAIEKGRGPTLIGGLQRVVLGPRISA